jgi:hypothetical protein
MIVEGKNTGGRKPGVWLKKIARISSWLLLAGVVVLVVSGWGITQTGAIYRVTGGLIDRRIADVIHRGTVFPLTFFFLLHVFINISLGINGKRRWLKWIVNCIFIVAGAAILALVIYMEYFRLGG